MTLTAHEVSVALFLRGLTQLKVMLAKGEAHVSATGMDPAALLGARLADDMYDLAAQVRWAADSTVLAVARLVGEPVGPGPQVSGFGELNARIDEVMARLRAVSAEDLEAGLERTIAIAHRGQSVEFTGAEFLAQFALPNFYFHLTTAYGLLRLQGVPLTKGDFMGFSFG